MLDKPNKPVRIQVAAIDPTRFNLVDNYLKVPTFRLCTRIVPSYATAKKIFDDCAKQSSHLPGPYDISPCMKPAPAKAPAKPTAKPAVKPKSKK